MDKIKNRIEELEQIEKHMNEISRGKRLELANKEAEANELREIINANNFINTEGYKELEELKIAQKWINWAKDIATEE